MKYFQSLKDFILAMQLQPEPKKIEDKSLQSEEKNSQRFSIRNIMKRFKKSSRGD